MTERPFAELLSFTDSEGYICQSVAKKIAYDFERYEFKARVFFSERNDTLDLSETDFSYGNIYMKLKDAMTEAANGGVVVFR